MKERESLIIGSLTAFMLILWVGFLVHHSPRFAGSLVGGILAISGSTLMMIPFAYVFIKRIKWIKRRFTKVISMRMFLTIHIYAGILGPILVLLHTGHKFESALGIGLTAMTIIVVLSGYIGRYLLKYISKEMREKKKLLQEAQKHYQQTMEELQANPDQIVRLQSISGIFSRFFAGFFFSLEQNQGVALPVEARALRLSESISDLEYAIKSHNTFKEWFSKWLKIHIFISFILLGLIIFHVWGAIYFGLRWSPSWAPTTLSARSNGLNFSDDGLEAFSKHFARLYKRHWRPNTVIHGYKTTVFDYAELAKEAKKPGSDFNEILAALRRVDLNRFKNVQDQKAFWINVYNFTAMKMVAEKYPINSITDKKVSQSGDPWAMKTIEIAGKMYGLRQIEKEILLKKFKDPRIIFAVSCAAVSCPNRTPSIFYGKDLNSQLDEMIRNLFKNRTKGLIVQRDKMKIKLSWILKADKHLFDGKENPTLIDFVLRYAPTKQSGWIKTNQDKLKIDYFEHDWTLNDTAQADGVRKK